MSKEQSEAVRESFDPSKYGRGGGPFDMSRQASIMGTTLQVAVPLWVENIKAQRDALPPGLFWETITTSAKRCSDVIAEQGDCLMFKSRGKTATAFNALAEGLACLSFCPGGVRFMGMHWETDRER